MPRSQHGQVAVIQSCQLGFSQPLYNCRDGGIDKADIAGRAPITEFADPSVIGLPSVLNHVRTGTNVIQ